MILNTPDDFSDESSRMKDISATMSHLISDALQVLDCCNVHESTSEQIELKTVRLFVAVSSTPFSSTLSLPKCPLHTYIHFSIILLAMTDADFIDVHPGTTIEIL